MKWHAPHGLGTLCGRPPTVPACITSDLAEVTCKRCLVLLAPPKRVVHCKRAPHDVYIGRPSKWGNPIPVPSKGYDRVADPDRILERFEAHVRSRPDLMAALPELAGKVLGCWCAPQRCHGDVLVRMADEAAQRQPLALAAVSEPHVLRGGR